MEHLYFIRVISYSEKGETELRHDFSGESDEILMLSFQEGNDRAFEELVRRYKDKIFSYVYNYIGNIERAEEIAQEVFIRVFRSRQRYQLTAKFATFIYRIALNLAYNEVRDRNRRKTDVQNDFQLKLKDNHTPESDYERNEVELLVRQHVNMLPPKYADVVILCDLQKLSYKEASQVLSVSIGTVQSRLSRGRFKLRQSLEKVLNFKS